MTPVLLAAVLAASWAPQKSGADAQLRGIAVLDATHAFASGAAGTVLRTRDGGRWVKLVVPGGEALDFRDVEALGAETVLLMSAGTAGAARIYRSADGGTAWTLVHTNPDAQGFYDAIAFWNADHGLLLGDPVDGRFVVRLTDDGGRSWTAPPADGMPPALPGEGAFAASGTCLFALKGGSDGWFVTGGAKTSRVFHTSDRGRTWIAAETPVPAGNASSGLFSVAFLDGRRGFTAGGDYKQPGLTALNGARTEDGGKSWTPAPISPSGFFSAVVPVPGGKEQLVAVGPGGSALSRDAGRTWTPFDKTPLNAAAFAGPDVGWAVGPEGTIVRFRRP